MLESEINEILSVDIASDIEQRFNGEVFRLYGSHKYFTNRNRKGTAYLHRAVWEFHHGPIPKGYHIHHKDGDRTNNQLKNLECLTPAEHVAIHEAEDKEGRNRTRMAGLELARIAAVDWHRSPEGLEWHRQHGEGMRGQKKPLVIACTCKFCGRDFMASGVGSKAPLFCSKNCKTRERYHSGIDHEDRACANCGGTFRANRYASTAYCCRSCSAKANARKAAGSVSYGL